MKEEILILNVLKYENEKGTGCRLGFIFNSDDKIQNTDKFRGYPEVSQFYDVSVFDKILPEMIGVPVTAVIEQKSDTRNPLRTRQLITKLQYKNNVIDLV